MDAAMSSLHTARQSRLDRLTHAPGLGFLLAASTALVTAAMFGFVFSPL